MKAKKPQVRSINPEKRPLSIDKLKELSGMQDLTDEQADEIISSIHKFAKNIFELVNIDRAMDKANIHPIQSKDINKKRAA